MALVQARNPKMRSRLYSQWNWLECYREGIRPTSSEHRIIYDDVVVIASSREKGVPSLLNRIALSVLKNDD